MTDSQRTASSVGARARRPREAAALLLRVARVAKVGGAPAEEGRGRAAVLALPDQVLRPVLCAHVAHRRAPLAQPPRRSAGPVAAPLCAAAEDIRALGALVKRPFGHCVVKQAAAYARPARPRGARRVGAPQRGFAARCTPSRSSRPPPERRAEARMVEVGRARAALGRGTRAAAERACRTRARFPGRATWPPAPPERTRGGTDGRSAARGSARCAAHRSNGRR